MGTWFALSRPDDANRIATWASALAAVAAIGVAVWTAWRAPSRSVTVSDTGKAKGKKAVTGVVGRADTVGTVVVERSGDAIATDGGDAVTGVALD